MINENISIVIEDTLRCCVTCGRKIAELKPKIYKYNRRAEVMQYDGSHESEVAIKAWAESFESSQIEYYIHDNFDNNREELKIGVLFLVRGDVAYRLSKDELGVYLEDFIEDTPVLTATKQEG